MVGQNVLKKRTGNKGRKTVSYRIQWTRFIDNADASSTEVIMMIPSGRRSTSVYFIMSTQAMTPPKKNRRKDGIGNGIKARNIGDAARRKEVRRGTRWRLNRNAAAKSPVATMRGTSALTRYERTGFKVFSGSTQRYQTGTSEETRPMFRKRDGMRGRCSSMLIGREGIRNVRDDSPLTIIPPLPDPPVVAAFGNSRLF